MRNINSMNLSLANYKRTKKYILPFYITSDKKEKKALENEKVIVFLPISFLNQPILK